MSATLLPLSKFLRQMPDPRKKRVVGHPSMACWVWPVPPCGAAIAPMVL